MLSERTWLLAVGAWRVIAGGAIALSTIDKRNREKKSRFAR